MKSLVLQELSWPELDQYLKSIKLVLVPVGSQEQHGPNLTFSTDTDRAYEMAKRLGERLYPEALVLPPVGYGISYHHMKFPGTITLQPETLIAILTDIAASLKQHGLEKVLFLNGHGGNRGALTVATTKIRFQMEMQTAYVGVGTDMAEDLLEERGASAVRGHSCEGEVAQSMYVAPWLVKEDRLTKGELKDTPYQRRKWWGQVPWSFDEVTANGALGDATRASVELGQDMTVLILDRLEAFAREFFL